MYETGQIQGTGKSGVRNLAQVDTGLSVDSKDIISLCSVEICQVSVLVP
jgi:hypothetical protein